MTSDSLQSLRSSSRASKGTELRVNGHRADLIPGEVFELVMAVASDEGREVRVMAVVLSVIPRGG
ncbi:hypothetical protein [Demequina oxidasica]|uniref:hypothetical protein n=1 Tax=Demequina oxidasica TaxID=676199 RepID=UPI000783B90A|nr:hypothetical protein [Demequina oxidasica]